MTAEKIKEILPSSFEITSISETKEQIYSLQKYNGVNIAKYVFDIDIDNNDIDINEYQDKFISKDFFESEGNLQWNYYLIFLRDKLPEANKRNIEKDESYARKFVLSLDELEDYLNYEKTTSSVEENVVDKWKAKLDESDLQEVYSNEPYSQAIPRYLNNKTKKIEELRPVDEKPDTNQDFVLDGVSHIKLNSDYRDFPEKRDFYFGKANLICGPNGVGKTSLMEGIELVITGNNARNENNLPNEGSIEAKYEADFDEKTDSYVNNIPKFKARNYYWYNTAYNKKKSNSLHRSFNRYNFYNSDSAYHLSNSTNNSEFTSYLSSIALGTEFGAIRERMMGFRKRLIDELKSLSKNINREKALIDNAKKQKENLKKIANPDEIFQKFLHDAKKIKWIKTLPQSLNDETKQFEADYDTIIGLLNSIVHSKVAKESDALSKLISLEELQKKLQSEEQIKKEINVTLSNNEKEISKKEGNLELLRKAFSYLDNPKSFKVETIHKEIQTLEQTVSKIEVFLDELGKLKVDDINSQTTSFKEFKEILKQNLESKQEELNRSQEQLQIVKDTLDKIKSIIVDIKYYGKEYIEVKKDVQECPLCETPHTKSELQAKIQADYSDDDNAKNIEVFNKNIGLLEKEISKVKAKFSLTRNYEDLLKGYFAIDISQLPISELEALVEQQKLDFEKYKKELEELKNLDLDLRLEGFELNDFLQIRKGLSTTYGDTIFKLENKEKFENLRKTEQGKVEGLKSKIDTLKKNLKESNSKIEDLVKGKYNLERYSEELDFEIKEYQAYRDYFLKLRDFIEFEKDGFIIELRHQLEALNKTFQNFKEQKMKFEELSLANKIIKESNESIEKWEPKKTRAKSGIDILNKFIEEDSEDKILNDFFRKNEKEISEIFSNIHSPKEFSRLSFESGEILLYKKSSNAEVPISQISTGQRSALALSIFLALNKKLIKGPNLIIFDDPVTYTDDLNILSFLDYLRSMVVNESRQLIFATASKKIAKLFEKKFEFLKSDFRKFELSRNTS